MELSNLNMYTGGVLSMLYSAGPVAKAVVLILLCFSILSWTIIFFKIRQFNKTEKDGERFIKTLKEIDSFKKLVSIYKSGSDNAFYRLFIATYKGLSSTKSENPGITKETLERLENILKITISEEAERLERRLSFLATTANTAPFIGLFGTVWGIMDAFREIGLRGTTSLAVVAPGISEALITTAIGLAAAIPAVLAYNYFLGRLKGILSKMENASIYLLNSIEK
ncbi:MAG TPA: MotA/TolQ/ExbB proton channel family protein [Syntrophorhabdaceae bacterium]|nr:MotA/TolQ/ExbB proton channel family protein [Syntrophorhabdaceae bacterium]